MIALPGMILLYNVASGAAVTVGYGRVADVPTGMAHYSLSSIEAAGLNENTHVWDPVTKTVVENPDYQQPDPERADLEAALESFLTSSAATKLALQVIRDTGNVDFTTIGQALTQVLNLQDQLQEVAGVCQTLIDRVVGLSRLELGQIE